MVECLLNMQEALCSIPSTVEEKINKTLVFCSKIKSIFRISQMGKKQRIKDTVKKNSDTHVKNIQRLILKPTKNSIKKCFKQSKATLQSWSLCIKNLRIWEAGAGGSL